MNVLNERVHKFKNPILYDVLEQGTMGMSLALNEAWDQGKGTECSNEHAVASQWSSSNEHILGSNK